MAVLPLFLALVLTVATGHKLVQRDRLATATGRLLGLAPPLALPAMLAAAAIEAAAAIALLVGPAQPVGALIAALLWGTYGALLARARAQGDRSIDCGCSLAVHRTGITVFAVARAFGLAAVALLAALMPQALPGIAAEPLFAALALFALLLAAGEIAALPGPAGVPVR